MYMGIELNPRFGKYFDFKLFTNGRPGIIAVRNTSLYLISLASISTCQIMFHATGFLFLKKYVANSL
jgi:hypothetical protein